MKDYLKALGVPLSAMMLAFFMTGCTGAVSTSRTESSETNVSSTADAAAEKEVEKEIEKEEKIVSQEKTVSKEESSKKETSAEAFSEIVLVDNAQCLVKITAIDEDDIWGYTLKAYIENRSSDKNMMFSMEDVSVNGLMCDPFWAESVKAGAKSNTDISFSNSALERSGISQITEISGTIRVHDDDDWMADDYVKEAFQIYPMGEAAASDSVAENVEGDVIFEEAQRKMTVQGWEMDDLLGFTADAYLENRSEKTLMFSIDGSTVNGFMCDPFWVESVAPGKHSRVSISWPKSQLEENGIDVVTEIAMDIRVHDADDFMAEDVVAGTYTVKFEH